MLVQSKAPSGCHVVLPCKSWTPRVRVPHRHEPSCHSCNAVSPDVSFLCLFFCLFGGGMQKWRMKRGGEVTSPGWLFNSPWNPQYLKIFVPFSENLLGMEWPRQEGVPGYPAQFSMNTIYTLGIANRQHSEPHTTSGAMADIANQPGHSGLRISMLCPGQT